MSGVFFFMAVIVAFFCAKQLRIICSAYIIGKCFRPSFSRFFYVLNLRGRVAGGLGYWRGRVFAGGVDDQCAAGVKVENGGGAQGGGVREAAPAAGLLVGLPADAESGGALRGAGVAGGEQLKEGLHGGRPVRRARFRVVVWNGGGIHPVRLCQRVVDGPEKGQSLISIAC